MCSNENGPGYPNVHDSPVRIPHSAWLSRSPRSHAHWGILVQGVREVMSGVQWVHWLVELIMQYAFYVVRNKPLIKSNITTSPPSKDSAMYYDMKWTIVIELKSVISIKTNFITIPESPHIYVTHPPHTHYTPTTHPPHTHHTPTTHPPHTHHTPITHLPHTHHTYVLFGTTCCWQTDKVSIVRDNN